MSNYQRVYIYIYNQYIYYVCIYTVMTDYGLCWGYIMGVDVFVHMYAYTVEMRMCLNSSTDPQISSISTCGGLIMPYLQYLGRSRNVPVCTDS